MIDFKTEQQLRQTSAEKLAKLKRRFAEPERAWEVKPVERLPDFLSSNDINKLIGGDVEREEQRIHDFLIFAMGFFSGIISTFVLVSLQ